ncbi:MAG: glycosyltransferase family 2 protein [Cetobacterium sp.]
MEKVSVIIPTYKRSEFLKRAIESVLEQSYKNIEIVVVDDNLNDSSYRLKTEIIMLEYKNNIKIIYLKNSENKGGALSRNEGIKVATGKYITFLDDDDFYFEKKIELQILEFKKNVNLDFVVCGMKIYSEEEKKYIGNKYSKIGNMKDFILTGDCYTPMIMVKKDKIIEINMLDNIPKFQDKFLIIKFLKNEFKYKIVCEFLFAHTIHFGERITYNYKTKEAIQKIQNIETEFNYLFSKKELKYLKLKNNLQEISYLQSSDFRDRKLEFKKILISFYLIIVSFNFIYLKSILIKTFKVLLSTKDILKLRKFIYKM